MRLFWGLISAFLLMTSNSFASTFENMRGTYRVLSCENLGALTRESICEYSRMTVHPDTEMTDLYFSKWNNNFEVVRSFALPASMRELPHASYIERGDVFAAFSNDESNVGKVIVLRRKTEDLYHLSIHLKSNEFNSLDVIEMDLEKMSSLSRPVP